MAHTFTLGVEEEFQIIDPATWQLRSHVSELIASGTPSLGDQIKPELHQSIVEVGTRICQDVGELRTEIGRVRRELITAAEHRSTGEILAVLTRKGRELLDRYFSAAGDMPVGLHH